jgi:PAT family beta-lactamase induction signal transducer AmpG
MTLPEAAPTWHSYLNQRMLILLFMGFSSGLPLFILLSLLQAWLAKAGLDVRKLGLFALVMFPYTWKFLWSPLMDRFSFGWLGRRRGWMALTQGLLFLLIGGMGMLDPATQIGLVAMSAAAVAFVSASQDIVIDAYRRQTTSRAWARRYM